MLTNPDPVLVVDLFPEERAALLEVLRRLSDEQWQAPTACSGWSVKDVAAHLLGGDLGKISRLRDDFSGRVPCPDESLGTFLDRINQEWVVASRRLSPQVLCDLLEKSGEDLFRLFQSLDLFEVGGPVTWAGPDPAPVWLDIAREYTERWHHQQHIREAAGMSTLNHPRFMAPVLATFVRVLPHTYRDVQAPDCTMVQVHILGDSGGDWIIRYEDSRWQLYIGTIADPAARVTLGEDVAWRLFTNGIPEEHARRQIRLEGDGQLASQFHRSVAIIV